MSEPTTVNLQFAAHQDPTIRALEAVISRLLRVGVNTSVALIIAGTIATFVQHPAYLTSSTELEHIVAPGATFPHSVSVLLTGLHQLRGEAIVILGLLVLMATPMMRVCVSVVTFIYHRDRIYILVTATVLCLLLLSLVLGRAE
jgi:uncharacterized membrane protein